MIRVTCAILSQQGRVLAAQRSESMALPLQWELPGGKIEAGESPEAGLRREIREELGIRIAVAMPLPPVRHASSRGAILLFPFLCRYLDGAIVLNEHKAMRWLGPHALSTVDWAAADRPVLRHYLRFIRHSASTRWNPACQRV